MIGFWLHGVASLPVPSSASRPFVRTLLTIAGHDPTSGAGITADLQTFAAHRLLGTSAITALTVQSTLGVAQIHPVPPALLQHTLQFLCSDLTPAGIKIGMLGSDEVACTVASFLAFGCKPKIPVVLDPILQATSGASLLPPEALDTLHTQLLPHITWITPNWFELSALTALPVETLAQAEAAVHALGHRHPHLHIVATAGDHSQPTDLLRLPTGEIHRFVGEHIESTSTHGTGCAFSSALLCLLVLRDTPTEAVRGAKHYVTEAIRRAPNLGHGNGPLNLLWHLS
jgi:hydroxymethylpyrimidine/phosphomethylpyrimidine kinase